MKFHGSKPKLFLNTLFLSLSLSSLRVLRDEEHPNGAEECSLTNPNHKHK